MCLSELVITLLFLFYFYYLLSLFVIDLLDSLLFQQLLTFYFYILNKSLKVGFLVIILSNGLFSQLLMDNGIIWQLGFYNLNMYQQQNTIFKMRKSLTATNLTLHQAYTHLQDNKLPQSMKEYKSLLQSTTNPQYRLNIICTISIINSYQGEYEQGLELLEEWLEELEQGNPTNEVHRDGKAGKYKQGDFLKLRYLANLCLLAIINGKYQDVPDYVHMISQVVHGLDQPNNIIMEFLFTLFFRVKSLDEIINDSKFEHSGTLLQAFYMLNLAIAKDIIGVDGSEHLLKQGYVIFLKHKKIELAFICIRQLLLLPLCNSQITKYQKQLSKIVAIEHMQNYQLDNSQCFECCKLIAQQLIKLSKQFKISQRQKSKDGLDTTLWRLFLKYENRKLMRNASICEEERKAIKCNIQLMLNQSDELVISQMKMSDFYRNAQKQIMDLVKIIVNCFEKSANKQIYQAFKTIKMHLAQQKSTRKLARNQSYTKFANKKIVQKQNRMPVVLVRDRSAKSLISKSNLQIQSVSPLKKAVSNNNEKTIYKMIKFCEYGSFLSKRNFNSDGGEYRFVRVTQSVLKWAKNPQKIQQSCQFYPLKDITAIVYGKCTPNLMKQSNHLLKQQYCFSLKLIKRTLDFYCKDYEQTCSWVCGLTHKLKQINPNVRGYTQGRMLWKRMFMIMRENFTDKLRAHQKKYYYQTAQAVILFGKNGCKLPNKL